MKSPRLARTVAALSLLAAVPLAGCANGSPEQPGQGPTSTGTAQPIATHECTEGKPLTHEFPDGTAWDLCWSVDPDRGLVLSDVVFRAVGEQPHRIIDSIALAQLEVPYDDGERLTSDITEAGFGGGRMATLTEGECAGDRLSIPVPNIGDGTYGSSPEREVLCSESEDSGLAYRSHENRELTTARASEWRLYTISKVGWYEYINQFTFGSDGTIRPMLGATGDLSPLDYGDAEHGWAVGEGDADYAASHSHNAVWRVDWGLGDGEQAVEQYDAEETGEDGSKAPIIAGSLARIEKPATAQVADRRWWRVLDPDTLNADGHPISYEIAIGKTDSFTSVHDHHHHPGEEGYDVAFTNADDCQLYATDNRENCGSGVLDYIAASKEEPLSDVVSWVAVGFHHVPKDEDQSPMEMHWQGFTLSPRDLLAQRPSVPEGREGYNGQPETWEGEDVDELKEIDLGQR